MIKKVFVTKIVEEEREVFTFDELSEEVQEKLIEKYREEDDNFDFNYTLTEEIIPSFKLIAEHCNMNIDYSYGIYDNYTRLTTTDDIEELKGVRAFAYVWNNYIEPNFRGKYLKYVNGKAYYSKCTKTWECPFTGICFDDVLYEAFLNFKENFILENTVDDFIEILENEMSELVSKEANYYTSEVYIIDKLKDDNYYFADGEIADLA